MRAGVSQTVATKLTWYRPTAYPDVMTSFRRTICAWPSNAWKLSVTDVLVERERGVRTVDLQYDKLPSILNRHPFGIIISRLIVAAPS